MIAASFVAFQDSSLVQNESWTSSFLRLLNAFDMSNS